MNYLEKNLTEYKKDLAGLIKIQSWLKLTSGYPINQLKEALEYMANLAKRDGMRSYVDPDGYYGYIEIGEGEELIGFLGHLDVVPPGDKNLWDSDPFVLTEKDGKLFGRGAQDDKGPVMLSYYLMKQLNEEQTLNKRIRLIMGTDEEVLWRGIDKYKADGQEHLTFGITPDACFPVTYLEKALVQYNIISKETPDFELTAGVAHNAVPDSATLIVNGEEKTFSGKTAHAMEPWNGENAIYNAVKEVKSNHPLIKFIQEKLNYEPNGETLFGKVIKDDSSVLTITLSKAKINKDKAVLCFDSRLPSTITLEEFEAHLKNVCEQYNLTYERYDSLPGVSFDKDSKLIKELMQSYQEVTGDMSEAIATGGATYARAMDNIIAFGPLLKETEITEHQPNERITIKEFIKVYDIYYKVFMNWLK